MLPLLDLLTFLYMVLYMVLSVFFIHVDNLFTVVDCQVANETLKDTQHGRKAYEWR